MKSSPFLQDGVELPGGASHRRQQGGECAAAQDGLQSQSHVGCEPSGEEDGTSAAAWRATRGSVAAQQGWLGVTVGWLVNHREICLSSLKARFLQTCFANFN